MVANRVVGTNCRNKTPLNIHNDKANSSTSVMIVTIFMESDFQLHKKRLRFHHSQDFAGKACQCRRFVVVNIKHSQ